jgi:hypothetical protein
VTLPSNALAQARVAESAEHHQIGADGDAMVQERAADVAAAREICSTSAWMPLRCR